MPNPTLFTIITITLNNIDGLKNTAASIHGQTNQDIEWLVIDGASNDGTPEWLRTTNADWTSESDNGIYDAMNKGIERAKGQYLLFLNAGDTLAEPDTLANIAQTLHECSITPDFIYGDALEELAPGEVIYKPARPYTKRKLGMFTHHQAMLYNRTTLGNIRYNEQYKIAADYDLTLRLLENTDKVLYIPAPLCIFESGGISQQQVKLGRQEQMQIRKARGLSNPIGNAAICITQSLAWRLRTKLPNLYWGLKSR